KTFLYQNLQASLQNAKWAVLHQNNDVFQSSLTTSMNWIKQYFVQDATETTTMLDSLAELQKLDIQPATVDLDATLQLFKRDNTAMVDAASQQAQHVAAANPMPELLPTVAAAESPPQPQLNGQS